MKDDIVSMLAGERSKVDPKDSRRAVTTSAWMGNSSVIESHFNAFLLAFRAELALFMQ